MLNTSAFMKAEFKPRTKVLGMQCLAPFFDKDETPEITVRGLTAVELAQCNEAATKNKSIDAIITALTSGNESEKVNAIRESMGLSGGDMPTEIAKRLEMFVLGVEPKVNLQFTVKFAEKFPVEFMQVTNEITTLTGQGAELVK